MAEEEISVGLIGAGGNVRNRHIPGFRKVEGTAPRVVNRSVSRDIVWQSNLTFHALRPLAGIVGRRCDQRRLHRDLAYMHRTLTLAALEKGKHVLTEARMASTAQEARDMLAAARSRPHLVCQLTPTSTTYKIDRILQRLIGEGFLGELLSVEYQALQNRFADLGALCTGATTGS
jgi:predicted dehydrogenase